MDQDIGVTPQAGSGHSSETERCCTVSAQSVSVPNAVTIPGELYAFLMGEGPLEGVWFGDLNEGLPGAFWWRGLLKAGAGWPEAANLVQVAFDAGEGHRCITHDRTNPYSDSVAPRQHAAWERGWEKAEAASAIGETTQIGSTEGESAVAESETPDPHLTPSKESDNA